MHNLDFKTLREVNVKRNDEVFSPCNSWTPMEWGCAMAGEAGEVCNKLKKLKRHFEGTNTSKDPQTEEAIIKDIEEEIADVILYLDLTGAKLNIDLGIAVSKKFNKVSDRMGATIYL